MELDQITVVVQMAQELNLLLEHAEVVLSWGDQLLDCHMLQSS